MKIQTTWEVSPNPLHYLDAIKTMENYVQNIIDNKFPNKVWLLEHFDVYTSGSSAKQEELLNTNNIEVINTNRGGKFTYHGIGQRIIYPMINLNNFRDIKLYISCLENWIIATLKDFDVNAFKKEGMIGIWTFDNNGKEKKIGAIGIHIKKWIAYHGIAVNINPDLTKFSGIVPCGISNFGVSSLHDLKKNVTFKDFDKSLKINFNKVFI